MVDLNPSPNLDTPWLEPDPRGKGNPAGINRVWWRWLIAEFEGLWSTVAGVSSGGVLYVTDGVPEPDTITGTAQIYVDEADGGLKVKFGDGTIKVLATNP